MAEVPIGAAARVVAAPLVRSRRRRPGKVAAKVLRVVRERRRLLALKADLETAYQAELAELQRVHARHVARIEAQLRDLDRGLMPQPLREDDFFC